MAPVRQFYVDNLRGDLAATVAAAKSATGAVYPPGSVIQLIPGEAMVKREKGFSPATRDWEFFELDVSKNGTQIRKRGFADVVNRFGGNCFACHIAARPQWDLVCESDHGCAPIPVTRAMIGALQRTDPRCDHPAPSPEDAEALRQLQQLLGLPLDEPVRAAQRYYDLSADDVRKAFEKWIHPEALVQVVRGPAPK